MKNVAVKILVKNGNFSLDLKRFKDAGIDFYSVKPVQGGTIVTLPKGIEHKFFAICKNMCYNTRIIRYSGLFGFIFNAAKNAGIIAGVISLFALNYAFGDVIVGVEKTGSGKNLTVVSKEAESFGVKAGGRFSKIDYARAKSLILSDNPSLSFVTLKKEGNRLIINTVKATVDVKPLSKERKDLLTGVSGVVKSIIVLRGTPLVKAGDSVNAGDAVAGAYIVDKNGAIYPAYVLATVEIESEQEYFYKKIAPTEFDFPYAKQAAKFMLDGDVAEMRCEIVSGGVKVVAKVTHTFIAG